MTRAEKEALALASVLLEYPDENFFEAIPDMQQDIYATLADAPEQREAMAAFLQTLVAQGEDLAREHYVMTFDHDPASSLYLTWHRYGNDRAQGKAMAAINGLYRAAGFEPQPGVMPDYLPRVLEFLSVCDDWAIDVILDGFGPEIAKLVSHLHEIQSEHAQILDAVVAPLRRQWPERFKPRRQPDPTLRPMAMPEPEISPFKLIRNSGVHEDGRDA